MDKRVNWKKVDETVRGYLGLRYHLVGVKIRRHGVKEEENRFKPEKPMAYCHMVRVASLKGKSFVYDRTDEACPVAEIILGFRAPKYTESEPRVKPSDTKSVLIFPIDQMQEDPDVILAVVSPKQMMDLTTILQAGKQALLSVGFKGEAACAEFTAKPFMDRKPNLSFLCNGARLVYSDFRDNELIFGAPPEIYTQITEVMEMVTKTGGTLCGCRTSDIPTEIIDEFEAVGLSKSTDYFFGRVRGHSIRVYLNKDPRGRLKFITLHLPVRTPSNENAREVTKNLRRLISRPYHVNQRGNWVDLTMTGDADELGIDLLDGESIGAVVGGFVDKATRYISRIGIKA